MAGQTKLVDILEQEGVLSAEEASKVRLDQLNTLRDVKSIILEMRLATPEQVAKAEAQFLNVPYVDLADLEIPRQALSLIPESVCRHYTLMPFELTSAAELKVAMKDPLDLQVKEFLEQQGRHKIIPHKAEDSQIIQAINKHYTSGMDQEVTAALEETEKEIKKIEADLSDLRKTEEIVRSAPVARIVNTILEYAVGSRASDVHIEPQEAQTRVRYRVDGVLREKLFLPKTVNDAVVSRVKILAHLKIDERRVPQDGRFMLRAEKEEVDLRVSTLPTTNGEKVVMRLLRKSSKIPSLVELGLRGRAFKIFEASLRKTHGIVLVTGPTGSGKTTTLRTALSMVNRAEVNIITVEDPVEYEIPGINQVQVNPLAGLTFASGLRSIVRQDPNIIMVGEIRDRETMSLAVQAALTGHLVFSTLHTNSAAGTFPRALDMGAEPFLLASTVEVVMAQRLARTLCQDCRKSKRADDKTVEMIKAALGPLFPKDKQGKLILYEPGRCQKCANTGYIGRVGIFEVLAVTDKIGRLILEQEPASRIEEQAISEGMVKMIQDGFMKVLEGVTTVSEILRVAQE